MDYVEHYLTIDLLRERVQDVLHIREESVGHRLHVRLCEGMTPYVLPEAGEGLVQFVYEKNGTKSDTGMAVAENEAVCVIPRAALDAVGDVDCEVRVYTTAAGTWTTTAKFTLDVQRVIYDPAAQQELVSDPTVYEQIVSSEAARVAAEALRVAAEEGRVSAEADRVSAEAARATADENRTRAEAGRVAAEEARVAAEEARQAAGYLTPSDVDDALSETSENPVQNKVIKSALDNIQSALQYDEAPTEDSTKLVKSGGIYTALEAKQDTLEFDNSPTSNSDNPVKSSGIYAAILNNKNIYIGKCFTAASEQVKEVYIQNSPHKNTNFPRVLVCWFQYGNTYNSGATKLKIMATGTQPQYYICGDKIFAGDQVTNYNANNAWQDGEIVTFVYDGRNYIIQKKLATSDVLGLVKISDAVDSTAQDTAASSKAVKTAYDLANGKADPGDIPTISKSSTVASDITDDTKTVSPKAMKTWVDAQEFALVSQIPEAFSLYVCGAGEYDTTTGVPTLQSPDNHHLYLTPNGTSYREYVYTGTDYELVGDTTVDLSNYVQTTDLVAYTETEIANLWSAASAST